MKIDLGSLTLGKRIGAGGFGEVFEVTTPDLPDHVFALKILNPHPFQPQNSRALERFEREAKLQFTLRHESIVPLYAVGKYEGKPFMLMERFNGFNLNEAKSKGGFDATIVLPFFSRIASALAYTHQRGIVHRDIKPANLMTAPGQSRVLDFGIAAIMDPDGERFTRTGGTPVGDSFSAPELTEDHRLVDPRCDIYSLGAVWYWLLTGFAPKGRNWEQHLISCPGVTKTYCDVIFRMLEHADKRYPTMDDVFCDIQKLIVGERPVSVAHFDDECISVIGVIYEQGFENAIVSLYDIERQTVMPKVRIVFRLNHLLKEDMVEHRKHTDWDGSYEGFSLTARGKEWVERNQTKVEEVLANLSAKNAQLMRPDTEEDMPF